MKLDNLQPYLDIAVSVLAKQDALATQKLKDFLVSMPSAKQIEQTLGFAVVQLAEKDPPAFEWVLSRPSILMPELDLKAFAQKIVRDRLHDGVTPKVWQSQGEQGEISLSEIVFADRECDEAALPAVLEQHFTPGERLMLKSFFPFEKSA